MKNSKRNLSKTLSIKRLVGVIALAGCLAIVLSGIITSTVFDVGVRDVDTINTANAAIDPTVYGVTLNSNYDALAHGSTYTFTDKTKVNDFRAGTISSDTTTITVDRYQPHGSQKNPYVINSINGNSNGKGSWNKFVAAMAAGEDGNGLGKYFVLSKDLDWQSGAIAFQQVSTFNGTLYGLGHSLKNVKKDYNDDTSVYAGVFLSMFGTLADLSVDNYSWTRVSRGGGLCGSSNGSFLNCHASGSATRTTALNLQMDYGGITCGCGTGFYVYRCSVNYYANMTSQTTNGTAVGGLVANSSGSFTVYDCFVNMKVDMSNTKADIYTGCIVGIPYVTSNNNSLKIENIYATVDVGDLNNLKGDSVASILTGYHPTVGDGNTISFSNIYVDGKVTRGSTVMTLPLSSHIPSSTQYPQLWSKIAVTNTNINYVSGYATFDNTSGKTLNNKIPTTAPTTTSHSNTAALQAAAKSASSLKVWDKSKIGTTYSVENNPVRNTSIRPTEHIAKFYNKKNGSNESLGIADITNYSTATAFPTPSTSSANHKFIGWTMDMNDDEHIYNKNTNFTSDIYGDVEFFAVWDVDSMADDTFTANKTTEEYLVGTITMTATVSATGMTPATVKYAWKKGSNAIGDTSASKTIENVNESGTYTVEYCIRSDTEPLWRHRGTHTQTVTITPGQLTPQSLSVNKTAYYGMPWTSLTPSAVMKNRNGNVVMGTAGWVISTGNVTENKSDPKYEPGKAYASFYFTPDSSYNNNYVSGPLTSSGGANYNTTATPKDDICYFDVSYIKVEFNVAALSTKFSFNLNAYNGALNYSQIANEFDKLFAAYYAEHTELTMTGDTPQFKLNTDGAFYKINDYRNMVGGYSNITEDISIDVTFATATYTVTYKYDDAANTADTVEGGKTYGQHILKPTNPTNGSMMFLGWYYDVYDNNGNKLDPKRWDFDADMISGDLVLTAKWLKADSLDRIVVTANKDSYTAGTSVSSGDLVVVAYYLGKDGDGQNVEMPVTLTWEEYKDNITYVDNTSSTDKSLHVKDGGFEVKVTFTYVNGTTYTRFDSEKLDVKPIKIDMSKLVIKDETFVFDDQAKDIKKPNLATVQGINLPDSGYITGMTYTYYKGQNEITQAEVKAIGNYRVEVGFITDSNDYTVDSISVKITITAEAEKLTVSWPNTTLSYNGKPQTPTPVFTDSAGNVVDNDSISFHFEGDTDATTKGSYTVHLVPDTPGYSFAGATTVTFTIEKAKLTVPTLKPDENIVYTGEDIDVSDFLDNFNSDLMNIIDGGVAKDAKNNYVATISLVDTSNCEWVGVSSQTVMVTWGIQKARLTAGWDESEHVADGNVFQPVVNKFIIGLAEIDKPNIDWDNDFIYTGDIEKSDIGAYTISVSFDTDADWTKNYIIDGNASWDYVIVPKAGMEIITVVWDNNEFIYNGSVQKPNFTVFDKNGNDITSQVASLITIGGDVNSSKWAGEYSAQASIANSSNYFIKSGGMHSYKILVDPVTGEGEEPPEEEKGPSFLDKIKAFFNDLIEKHFPLWQIATMAVAGILTIIFLIKAIQYGKRKKKIVGNSKANKKTAKAYSALLPIFSTDIVLAGLSNQIWTIMAFAMLGLAVFMLLIALIMRKGWKKAELAKETAQGENQNAMNMQNMGAMQAGMAQNAMVQGVMPGGVVQQGMMPGMAYGGVGIEEILRRHDEERRRDEEERRRQDEERHRQEMAALREEQNRRDEAMKIMLANMMGRQQMDVMDIDYAGVDDTDLLVQKVIAGLLPVVQQMIPEPTAYLSAPAYEQSASDIEAIADRVVERLGGQQSVQDNSKDMISILDEMNAMRQQIAILSQDKYDSVILDDDDEDIFDDEEEWDSILDEEEDDNFVEAVVIEADGTERKISPNFRMRLKQSSDKNREWYAVIKNMFCSQKGVTYRVQKRVEKIRYQGQVIGVIGIAKRSIKLWLALKPYEYDARRYHHKDVSDKPRFVDVPMYVRVGSDRALERAQELILALFQDLHMEARKRYHDRDIQELIFTLKHNKLLNNKYNKTLLREIVHVHDCDVLDDETAEKCIETKNVDFVDNSALETVKLDDIDAHFLDGNRVTLQKLKKVGLVSAECTGVNITADKRLTKPLIIVANDFSSSAVKMIVLTGGRAIKLAQVAQQ